MNAVAINPISTFASLLGVIAELLGIVVCWARRALSRTAKKMRMQLGVARPRKTSKEETP